MLKERETWATVDIATNTNSDGLATDSHCRSHPPMPNGEGKETSKVPDRDSTKPKGEKRAKIMAGHLLQCQHVNSETGLYIQRQLKKLCQLHALNALFGRNIVQPHSMLAFCEDEIQRDTALDRNLKNRGYCPHEGNFPDMVINTWLHYNSQPAVRLKCINDSIPRNSSEADFLGCLPGHIDAFVVRWDQGGLAHEDTGYGHAVCMRRHPATDKRYLLDSKNQRAKQMTPQLWKDLKGSMFALAKGSAYNHNVIVGARDEGYTQVEKDSNPSRLKHSFCGGEGWFTVTTLADHSTNNQPCGNR